MEASSLSFQVESDQAVHEVQQSPSLLERGVEGPRMRRLRSKGVCNKRIWATPNPKTRTMLSSQNAVHRVLVVGVTKASYHARCFCARLPKLQGRRNFRTLVRISVPSPDDWFPKASAFVGKSPWLGHGNEDP